MSLHIVRNDITKMAVDAIVNAAKNSLLGGGGVDGAIHRAAGPALLAECRTLGGCETGSAKLTKGYDLPAEYVIHTVGPVWQGGTKNEKTLLESCYTSSLALAAEYNCTSVAFPLISAGAYGYPKTEAMQVAADTISRWLAAKGSTMEVYLVVFDKTSYTAGTALYRDIESYIDDNYVAARSDSRQTIRRREFYSKNISAWGIDEDEEYTDEEYTEDSAVFAARPQPAEKTAPAPHRAKATASALPGKPRTLEEYIRKLDAGFSQTLLSLIDSRNMTDAQCYKKANISRKLFSKIRNDPHYHPAKATVLAFAIALELSLEETEQLLKKAGYALSHSDRADLIIEYFIVSGNYDIFRINDALYRFDQPLLGV